MNGSQAGKHRLHYRVKAALAVLGTGEVNHIGFPIGGCKYKYELMPGQQPSEDTQKETLWF